MHRSTLLLRLLPLAALLGLHGPAQVPFEPSWNGTPINASGSFPAIATEVDWSDGALQIVWTGGFVLHHTRSLDGGATFLPATVLPTPGSAFTPDVAGDGASVHLSYSAGGDICYRRSTDDGATFGPEATFGAGSNPRIAAGDGAVQVAYESTPLGMTAPEVYVVVSTDGGQTFGSPINLSQSMGVPSRFPHLASRGSTVYASWNDQTFPGSIYVRRSDDYGQTFGGTSLAAPIAASLSALGANIAVHPTDHQTVALAWTDFSGQGGPDVFGAISTDGGTSFPPAANLANGMGLTTSLSPEVEFYGSRVGFWWFEVDFMNGGTIEQFVTPDNTIPTGASSVTLGAMSFGFSSTAPRVTVSRERMAIGYTFGSSCFVDTAPLHAQLSNVGTGGCAGSFGVPTWTASGDFCSASTLTVGPTVPSTPGILVVATALAANPYTALGCILDVELAGAGLLPTVADASGYLSIQIPFAVPAGVEAYLKTAFADTAGPQGYSMSDTGFLTTKL